MDDKIYPFLPIKNPNTKTNNKIRPVYEHDCNDCLFVGHDSPADGEPRTNLVDMYIHLKTDGNHTLVRRYSSEGNQYASCTIADQYKLAPERRKRWEILLDTANAGFEKILNEIMGRAIITH